MKNYKAAAAPFTPALIVPLLFTTVPLHFSLRERSIAISVYEIPIHEPALLPNFFLLPPLISVSVSPWEDRAWKRLHPRQTRLREQHTEF